MSESVQERSARARLALERRREVTRRKRTRAVLVSLAAFAVVAAVVVGMVVVRNDDGEKSTRRPYTGALAPATVAADGTVVMAQPNAVGPAVDLYEDFQCPVCKLFESVSGEVVQRLAAEGKIKLSYHVLAFVNPRGSVRAAVAARCAADAGRFTQFHDIAYENQPDERTALTIDQLKGFGAKAGLTGGSFGSCVSRQQSAAQVQQSTRAGLALLQQKLGSEAGTPTLLVDGRPLGKNEMFNASALEKALLAART